MQIRAGTVTEVHPESGDWVFVDVGFANSARSSSILVGDAPPVDCTFAELKLRLAEICQESNKPLNLVLEAPLSVAFGANGNPAGRAVEKRNEQTRYWYVGLGCSVLVAATYLLRSIHDQESGRELRLFEGFVSFKPAGKVSSHKDDVILLRDIVWHKIPSVGRIVDADELRMKHDDRLESAFTVSGMDFGVPAVIMASGGKC